MVANRTIVLTWSLRFPFSVYAPDLSARIACLRTDQDGPGEPRNPRRHQGAAGVSGLARLWPSELAYAWTKAPKYLQVSIASAYRFTKG